MKKGIIILGTENLIEKSNFALSLFNEMIKEKHVIHVKCTDHFQLERYSYQGSSVKTKMIIFDNLPKSQLNELKLFYNLLRINLKYQRPFIINPFIVITSNCSKKDAPSLFQDLSFKYRFDVIEYI